MILKKEWNVYQFEDYMEPDRVVFKDWKETQSQKFSLYMVWVGSRHPSYILLYWFCLLYTSDAADE